MTRSKREKVIHRHTKGLNLPLLVYDKISLYPEKNESIEPYKEKPKTKNNGTMKWERKQPEASR